MKTRIFFRRLRRFFSRSPFDVVIAEITRRDRNDRRRIKRDKAEAIASGRPDPHPHYDDHGYPTRAAIAAGVFGGFTSGHSVGDGGGGGGCGGDGGGAC